MFLELFGIFWNILDFLGIFFGLIFVTLSAFRAYFITWGKAGGKCENKYGIPFEEFKKNKQAELVID